MPNSQNNLNPKLYIIYYLGNYIVYCICQYDKSELYANSAFKIVYFDGKSKRCSFTFMKIQWDPRLHKKQQHKKSAAFSAISSVFLLFLLGTVKSTRLNFFGPAKEQPSFLGIKIVWDYLCPMCIWPSVITAVFNFK